MMRERKIVVIFVLSLFLGASNALATSFVLDFEGLDHRDAVDEFYNGGVSRNGNMGTNYGVSFSDNTLAVIDSDAGFNGNIGGEPSPDTAMFFLTGNASIMNVAAGFDTGFSFFYSAILQPGSVSVFDEVNGMGNVLATLALPLTPFRGAPDPTGDFSPFLPLGVGFSGIAKSVSFAGAQNQIAFDNITFGSITPGINGSPPAIPEPSTFLLLGTGLAGLVAWQIKKGRQSV